MSNSPLPDPAEDSGTTSPPNSEPRAQAKPEPEESFGAIFAEYEQSHRRGPEEGSRQIEATVVAVSSESVFFDIGFKTEGILPVSAFPNASEMPKPGDRVPVTVKGRDAEGYYELSRLRFAQPKDWTALERAYQEKAIIEGTVTAVVKGGLSVDVGVRAFMPASRSGTRDAAEVEKLVGQSIRCRITKLDVTDEDVVVDRRAVAEEEERSTKERRYSEVREGDIVHGTIRSLTEYGAFVDLGGVDGLLHVSDISWSRVASPADVLSVGQQVEAKVLKTDPERQRISLGLKQLQPQPWDAAAERYRAGERVRGVVTRVVDFGAFVELEPGIEGLIHLSEMSWAKKVRKVSDILKPGDTVEAVVLTVNPGERRISLGLKQALGDPWAELAHRLVPGAIVEGAVTSFTNFGAFVQIAEGVEGMIHVSEISAEKRIHHPQDVLKLGQPVKAQVVSVDREKRQLRLSIKQMVPVGIDEYILEHKLGDTVTGRLIEVSGGTARVELGEGIRATCRMPSGMGGGESSSGEAKLDLSSLSSMLKARWKGDTSSSVAKQEPPRAGQIRSFRILSLDPAAKEIELELA